VGKQKKAVQAISLLMKGNPSLFLPQIAKGK
jgi:hypothetical protein